MRILITGADGFIGGHFYRFMKDRYKVIGLDRQFKRCNYGFIFKDLAKDDISGILERIDIVVHFAANTFVDHSVIDPKPFVINNIIGTFNLLEEARRYRVKKFIHISTDEVYGPTSPFEFKETDTLNPTNPYSATKAAADMLCFAYQKTYGIPIIVLRCENNYGTYQHPQKFIPTIIRCALQDKPLPIYGDGLYKRMWLRVEDFCSAIELVINKGEIGNIYNIGGKEQHENIKVADMVMGLLGKKHNYEFIMDTAIRPFHDRAYAVDTSKINALGWLPKYTLQTGLPEVVDWYVEEKEWLE